METETSQTASRTISSLQMLQVFLSYWKLALGIIVIFTLAGILIAHRTVYLSSVKVTIEPAGPELSGGFNTYNFTAIRIAQKYNAAFHQLQNLTENQQIEQLPDALQNELLLRPEVMLNFVADAWTYDPHRKTALDKAEMPRDTFQSVETDLISLPLSESDVPTYRYNYRPGHQHSLGLFSSLVVLRYKSKAPQQSIDALNRVGLLLGTQVARKVTNIVDANFASLESERLSLVSEIEQKIASANRLQDLKDKARLNQLQSKLQISEDNSKNDLQAQIEELKNRSESDRNLSNPAFPKLQSMFEEFNSDAAPSELKVIAEDAGFTNPNFPFAVYKTQAAEWRALGSPTNTIIFFSGLGFAISLLMVLLISAIRGIRVG